MSTGTFDFSIGLTGNENKELYKNIELTVELHQDKVAKISQEYASLLGKTTVPFVVIEYSQAHLEGKDVFHFKAHDYESAFVKVGGRLYQYCNPRGKDTVKLLKNLEKEFQRVGKLNNILNAKLSLYDPLREQPPQNPLLFLNQARLKGNAQTDPELVATLTEILRRVSNQFLNSPLMAFLQLLQSLNVKLNLSPIEEFSQQLKQTYLSFLNWKEWANADQLDELKKCKGDVAINITLPKLLSIRIKAEGAVLGVLLSIFAD